MKNLEQEINRLIKTYEEKHQKWKKTDSLIETPSAAFVIFNVIEDLRSLVGKK